MSESQRELTIRNATAAIIHQRDKILNDALKVKIGHTDWEIEDLTERGGFITTPDQKETFVFDGEPLVVFYPVEFQVGGDTLDIRQRFKVLYETTG